MKKATFGSGCFWCTEGIFKYVKGVNRVVSGYMGGVNENPTYEEVCSGMTGHAEVVQIDYDENVISFQDLLEILFKTHDPTTINRQGNDVGTQYRSVIFYHDELQKEISEKTILALEASGAFLKKIVTKVDEVQTFYPAEDYHQNYFENNPQNAYCQAVVRPKIEKFKKVFEEKLDKS